MLDKHEVTDELLEQVAGQFQVLSDPMRLKILHQLQQGEHTVSELVETTGGSQSNVSKHLSILRSAGLVSRRAEGNSAFFSIQAPFIFDVCDLVCNGIKSKIDKQSRVFK
jgi:DNA-binding transcriptional ArsR family regulator